MAKVAYGTAKRRAHLTHILLGQLPEVMSDNPVEVTRSIMKLTLVIKDVRHYLFTLALMELMTQP
jgi:hypothetical protein